MDDRPDSPASGNKYPDWDLDDPQDFAMAIWRAMRDADLDLLERLLMLDESLLTRFEHDLFSMPGDTILHEALRESSFGVVQYLIARGADVNANDESVIGDSPLDVAIHREDPSLIQFSLKHGANPNIPTWMWNTATDRAMKRLGDPACVDEDKRAALRAVLDAAERFQPPTYPDGTVPSSWPPTPDDPHPKRVQPHDS